MPRRGATALVAAVVAGAGGAYALAAELRAGEAKRPERQATRAGHEPRAAPEPIRWRRSTAVGAPSAGRLVRGVRLPAEGRDFFTWDPVLERAPNRSWRRYGTNRLVRLLLRVLTEYRHANRGAPRVGIGDLSRPRGGDFGRRFGGIGHGSHQNGLDADLYYPRRDRRERAPRSVEQVDRRLAQDLVWRLEAAGVEVAFVGPTVGLRGRRGRVDVLAKHDDHVHVRIGLRSGSRGGAQPRAGP